MTLPALDTSEISFLGYWNALDHSTEDSIDPTEVLNNGSVDAHNVYENGVEGLFSFGFSRATSRTVNFRVKDDGWFVAWLDTSGEFDTHVPKDGDLHGPYDYLGDWSYPGSVDPSKSLLAETIRNLYTELSNSGTITFNSSDVAHFNYEYPNATGITVVHSKQTESSQQEDVTPTDSTTVHRAYFAGSAKDGASGVNWDPNNQGLDLCGNGEMFGVPADDTTYFTNPLESGVTSTFAVNADGYESEDAAGDLLVLWS
ncbi:hypothetical protein [Natrinema longum]|uniref:Uncharacterized protein n=1 Tax=Natrinema longum TaxID=370324 RepID=A0A8A2UCX3_9EURY|nr:hypothetical protein [Natrinema longum]MBZ6496025.1 hypothetical protein [Natrinema longum]QSW86045.1 hypothetical protein J0X27_04215 [Natrinema longum]